MLLVSFIKGVGGFSYVFIITSQATTLVPIYSTTLVDHRVFVLGGDQEVLDGTATLWSTKVVPYIGTNVVTWLVMMNT